MSMVGHILGPGDVHLDSILLGSMGIEDFFQENCEIILGILKKNKDVILWYILYSRCPLKYEYLNENVQREFDQEVYIVNSAQKRCAIYWCMYKMSKPLYCDRIYGRWKCV